MSYFVCMGVQYSLRRGKLPARYPNEIRRYRIESGLTQRALASSIGRDRREISSWERGQTMPTLPVGLKLARELATLTESLYWGLYSKHPRR